MLKRSTLAVAALATLGLTAACGSSPAASTGTYANSASGSNAVSSDTYNHRTYPSQDWDDFAAAWATVSAAQHRVICDAGVSAGWDYVGDTIAHGSNGDNPTNLTTAEAGEMAHTMCAIDGYVAAPAGA